MPASQAIQSTAAVNSKRSPYVPGGQACQSCPVPFGQKYPWGHDDFTVDTSPGVTCSGIQKKPVNGQGRYGNIVSKFHNHKTMKI